MANAEGLADCKKLLTMAKAGKYNGYLLEGMACPGGCVAGAGDRAADCKGSGLCKAAKEEIHECTCAGQRLPGSARISG